MSKNCCQEIYECLQNSPFVSLGPQYPDEPQRAELNWDLTVQGTTLGLLSSVPTGGTISPASGGAGFVLGVLGDSLQFAGDVIGEQWAWFQYNREKAQINADYEAQIAEYNSEYNLQKEKERLAYLANVSLLKPLFDNQDLASDIRLLVDTNLINLLADSARVDPYVDPNLFRADHQGVFNFFTNRTDELTALLFGVGTNMGPADLSEEERALLQAELDFIDEQFLLLDTARVDGARGILNDYFATWGEGKIPAEARLFWEAQQNPELVTEMMDSDLLAPLLNTIFTSETAQGLIAEQLFTAPAGEDGTTIFNQAVQSAMVQMLYGDSLIEGSDTFYTQPDGSMGTVPNNPLAAMRTDMQTMPDMMGVMPVSQVGVETFDETGEALPQVDIHALDSKVAGLATRLDGIEGRIDSKLQGLQASISNMIDDAVSRAVSRIPIPECNCSDNSFESERRTDDQLSGFVR